ncbi:MAG TPA: hypothetical protein VKY74_23390 [Chloroflexia bacterium]|nr:hypothetical protein [Chloroflexia bacterium]
MAWIIYAAVVLAISGLIGRHLGHFGETFTEMTGMMAGMTMGMLNGFLLGYCAAAAIQPQPVALFWGNLFGILFGIILGTYFGRAGGLMGVLDGAIGGMMGGAMGAMLAVMLDFPTWALLWTAVLLGGIYVLGMIALVVLIEQSAPDHAHLHRLAPLFTRGGPPDTRDRRPAPTVPPPPARPRAPAASAAPAAPAPPPVAAPSPLPAAAEEAPAPPEPPRRLTDYYAFLGVPPNADEDTIFDAYETRVNTEDDVIAARAERALAVLSDPQQRRAYDRALAENKRALAAARAAQEPAAAAPARDPAKGGRRGR